MTVVRKMLAWLESIPPAFGDEKVAPLTRRALWAAVILALVLSALNLTLIVKLENTNLRTTNGLWKSPQVSAWEHGRGSYVDGGEFLYLPVYGFLCRLIPDSAVQFGVPAPMVTFRKIAVLNAFFGGMASACLFLLAMRLTSSYWAALMTSVGHAGAAFVMLNSINSEDIVPAYTLFVASTLFLFEYFLRGRPWALAASASALALATLMHWTIVIPALAAIAAAFLVAGFRNRSHWLVGALWLAGFFCAMQGLMLLALPRLHIPVWYAVFPGKANNGWQGLFWDKYPYVFVGIGNYFARGNNASAYQGIFASWHDLKPLLASWAWALLGLGACAVVLCRRSPGSLKCLALFGLTVFVVGEAQAFYSAAQDPQFQIEPMFMANAGALIVARGMARMRPRIGKAVALGCTVALTANGVSNYTWFRDDASGEDRRSIEAVTELAGLFPQEHTFLLTQGFDGWVTWQYVLEYHGPYVNFLDVTYPLTTPFTEKRSITASEAADAVKQKIDAALSAGKMVAANSLWTDSSEHFVALMSTLIDQARAREFDAVLRSSYRAGRAWKTKLGTFVELVPAGR